MTTSYSDTGDKFLFQNVFKTYQLVTPDFNGAYVLMLILLLNLVFAVPKCFDAYKIHNMWK